VSSRAKLFEQRAAFIDGQVRGSDDHVGKTADARDVVDRATCGATRHTPRGDRDLSGVLAQERVIEGQRIILDVADERLEQVTGDLDRFDSGATESTKDHVNSTVVAGLPSQQLGDAPDLEMVVAPWFVDRRVSLCEDEDFLGSRERDETPRTPDRDDGALLRNSTSSRRLRIGRRTARRLP
jgi:hypothetical protein